ncbi:MAG: IS1595 family transposase [Parvularculaceae bacterium]
MSIIDQKHFHDEKAAYAYVEAIMWPNGPVCPHCGGVERIGLMGGKSTRIGLYKCYQCRKPFTVKVGTIFESSHIPLRHWLQAIFLLAASKKGISSNQLHRTLGCTLKTAWFLSHRIREAMRDGKLAPFGGGGQVVEADETYYGPVAEPKMTDEAGKPFRGSRFGRGPSNKRAVIALVERGGRARTFHVPRADRATVEKIVAENVAKESRLHTDESHLYSKSGVPGMVSAHEAVKHSVGEYVRGDVHSNSAENYFSVFKRGMRGVYQKCDEKHLHRYLAEFDFRYSNRVGLGVNDTERAHHILRGAAGKRLTYQTTCGAP